MTVEWLTVAKWLAVPALVTAVWFHGDYHGQGVADAKCNVERLANAKAAAAELAKQVKRADAYAAQLQTANEALNAVAAELARAANAPVPHVMCYPKTNGGGSGVSTVPGKTGSEATGSGAPDHVWGSGFDPSTNLRNLHTTYAAAYAACIDTLNRWPNDASR